MSAEERYSSDRDVNRWKESKVRDMEIFISSQSRNRPSVIWCCSMVQILGRLTMGNIAIANLWKEALMMSKWHWRLLYLANLYSNFTDFWMKISFQYYSPVYQSGKLTGMKWADDLLSIIMYMVKNSLERRTEMSITELTGSPFSREWMRQPIGLPMKLDCFHVFYLSVFSVWQQMLLVALCLAVQFCYHYYVLKIVYEDLGRPSVVLMVNEAQLV